MLFCSKDVCVKIVLKVFTFVLKQFFYVNFI
jgi:hypothetical protein